MTILKRHWARKTRKRHGTVLVLAAVLMVAMFSCVALTVDMGIAYAQRTEMQRAADAAALAAANDLQDQQILNPLVAPSEYSAAATAREFVGLNKVSNQAMSIPDSDIEIGVLADRSSPGSEIYQADGQKNAVRVRVSRTKSLNGETPFLFAPVLGHHGVPQQVSATAAYTSSFRGFSAAPQGKRLGILPFTLDLETWDKVLEQETVDEWSWDPVTKTAVREPDGIYEVNLYPQDTGMPGNRGTVDIGHSGNSTSDISRQILDGISESDLEQMGGSIEFDCNGELALNGDTGISAAVKAQLEAIKGEPRAIPIFVDASGNGNNANYTIVKFVGVRILDVRLTGKMSKKHVIIQPAAMKIYGGIPDNSGDAPKTTFMFSPVDLVN